MLKEYGQTRMELSSYQNLYDMIIPPNHLLRRLKENIDFSFVNPMLKEQYCESQNFVRRGSQKIFWKNY